MDVFYALAEPNRRSIIELLASRGEMSATQIADKFQITSSAISQHLKVLREANLIIMEKRAQKRMYRINADTVRQLESWAQKMSDQYEQLDLLLKNSKRKGV